MGVRRRIGHGWMHEPIPWLVGAFLLMAQPALLGCRSPGVVGSVFDVDTCGNGIDDNGDGRIDEGCGSTCAASCEASELIWSRQLAPEGPVLRVLNDSTGVFTNGGVVFALGTSSPEIGHMTVRYSQGGAPSPVSLVYPSSEWLATQHSLLPMGTGLALVYQIDATSFRGTTNRWGARTLDFRGVANPGVLSGAGFYMAAGSRGDHVLVAWAATETNLLRAMELDQELVALSEIQLSPNELSGTDYSATVHSVVWTGSRWILGGRASGQLDASGTRGDVQRFWIVRDGEVERRFDLASPGPSGRVHMAQGPDRSLACWPESAGPNDVDLRCQLFAADGSPVAEPFQIGMRHASQLSPPLMVYWQCRFLIISPGLTPEDSWVGFVSMDGTEEAIALPSEVARGDLDPQLYWSVSFSTHTAGPVGTPFMMQGRGDTLSDGRHSLVQLSCP